MKWLLVIIFLNVQTGEPARFEIDKGPEGGYDAYTCSKAREDRGADRATADGLVAYTVCRQVDENGVPVPERKTDTEGKSLDDGKLDEPLLPTI